MKSKKKSISELSKSIQLDLDGNKFTVAFPNAGQLIDIESNKILFSNSQYSSMVRSQLIYTNMALDIVEMAATFVVLIPSLIERLRVTSIFELDIPTVYKLIKVYKKDFLPWYLDWIEAIQDMGKEDLKKTKSDSVEEPTSTTNREAVKAS